MIIFRMKLMHLHFFYVDRWRWHIYILKTSMKNIHYSPSCNSIKREREQGKAVKRKKKFCVLDVCVCVCVLSLFFGWKESECLQPETCSSTYDLRFILALFLLLSTCLKVLHQKAFIWISIRKMSLSISY